MTMIQKLLFPDMPQMTLENVQDLPLTFKYFIDQLSNKAAASLAQSSDPRLNSSFAVYDSKIRESNADKRKRLEEKNSKLEGWYGFSKKEVSKEAEDNFEALRLRKYLDKKHVMKILDESNRAYYSVGPMIEDPFEGKKGKIRKADRQRTMVEYFAKKDESLGFTKRKFQEIQSDKMKHSKNKKWRKLKRAQILGQPRNTLK